MGKTFEHTSGSTPLLVSLPHGGTHIPEDIANRMTPAALGTPDTDWHVEKLYDFAASMGASVIRATHSRYVIDLNRDPDGVPLYVGADNTELIPTTTFEFEPIYQPGNQPDEDEIANRTREYWQPYHRKLEQELADLKKRHGYAILFDGHTIKSVVPRFHDVEILDLNLGTAGGKSADADLTKRAFDVLENSSFSAVLNGRFTGGHITRAHGAPDKNIHALQLELTWRNYMAEIPPFRYREQHAEKLKTVLRALIQTLIDWQPSTN
ncbi:MAG: N-formylglutamate deformylase [Rhodospirillaceae bacterium]|nr:N-formylglutamate deformylase [Rhodospirillaceae bacterium]|tara:strand:+ start:3437 stop:4234 length:798 start_codon:yes stop_codon:yes gene_type:complete